MADNKDYWSTDSDQGNVKISEDVVASIAALSTTEIEGVSGLYSGIGNIAEFLGKKNLSKGVKVEFNGDCVEIEISFIMVYGFNICDVAKAVQKAVAASIESMTGLHVTSVDIQVGGVAFKKTQEAVPQQ